MDQSNDAAKEVEQNPGQEYAGEQDQEQQEGYEGEEGENFDGPVSSALAEQRVSRKRAQEDVKLLANRIALLKQEEKKAWKKIEETKKKATDIVHVRQRNADHTSEKMSLAQYRAAEEAALTNKNLMVRTEQKEAIKSQQMTKHTKNVYDAQNIKGERNQHEEMIQIQKHAEELKNKSMKQMVRNQKEEALEARYMQQQMKRQSQRGELIRKINEENEKRMAIESEVARLERDEAEWIKKLQNTNQVQATAFGELEVALNGDPHEVQITPAKQR